MRVPRYGSEGRMMAGDEVNVGIGKFDGRLWVLEDANQRLSLREEAPSSSTGKEDKEHEGC